MLPYGTRPTEPTNTAKTQDAQYTYTFDKWDPQIGPVTGDVTYTATYTKDVRKYTVRFGYYDLQNKFVDLKSDILEYGETPVAPKNVIRDPDDTTVYTFVSWDKVIETVKGDVDYIAQFSTRKRGKFNISYYIDGVLEPEKGDDFEYQKYAYEYETLVLPSYTLDDYYDLEWYSTPDLKPANIIKNNEIRSVGDNITVYGKRIAEHKFKIEYDLGSASFPSGHTYPSTITYSETVDLDAIDDLYAPLLTGHMFVGWFDEDGNQVKSLSSVTSDLKLTAKFEVKKFTISFNYTGFAGVLIEATYNTSDYLTELAKDEYKATKLGYEFLGWSLDGKLPAISGPYLHTTDIVLEPIFKLNEYSLSYVLNGGKLVPASAPTKYSIETYANALPLAEKIGYEFKGWQIQYGGKSHTAHPGDSLYDVFGNGYLEFEPNSQQDFTLSALYAAKNHQISYDYDGGVRVFTVTYKDGTTVVDTVEVAKGISTTGFKKLADKPGYQFAGWEDSYGHLVLGDKEIGSDMTLKAKWNKIDERDVYVPGADPVHEYDQTIAINDSETVPLYYMNGSYLQVTSLIDQDVTITSSASFSVLIACTLNVVGDSIYSTTGYSLDLPLKAGQSYSIKVVGKPDEIGSAIVSVNRSDASTDIDPHFTISGTNEVQPSVYCHFNEKIPHLDTLVKKDFVFDGWYYGAKRYEEGDVLDVDADITFVAHWHAAP